MMIPAIPRFAAVGDTFEAAAMVHNNEESAQRAKVSLGGEVREIELAASGRQRIAFPITADKAGTVKAILVENAQPVEFDQPLVVIG